MSEINMISEIPANIQTGHLREVQSDVLPSIRQEGDTVIIPIFVREQTRVDGEGDDAAAHTFYSYFEVPVAYCEQDIANYDGTCRMSYAAIRQYLYGDWRVQNEQLLKAKFTAHQYAVRAAFPKDDGEVISNIERFQTILAEFWTVIDSVLEMLGKTRQDLPPQPFTSEQAIAWAVQNGLTTEQLATIVPTVQNISLNLLHNGRNWAELFPAPEDREEVVE